MLPSSCTTVRLKKNATSRNEGLKLHVEYDLGLECPTQIQPMDAALKNLKPPKIIKSQETSF